MEKWEYKSLEWIHKVREEDYENTKAMAPKDIIAKTREAAEETARALGLKMIHSREQIRTH
jgi:hypothetical protein